MRFGILLALLAVTAPASAQSVRRADLKPGLVFTATDAAGSVSRLEPAVGLTLDPGEAAHPRSAGGDTFTWIGYIQVVTAGKYTFDADLLGSLRVSIGAAEVFAGAVQGDAARPTAGKEVELAAGIQPFAATLTRQGKGVRAALRWVGPGFKAEPVPNYFFGHTLPQRPAGFAADLQREHGRFLFEEKACAKCHKPDPADAMVKGLADRGAPNLTEIGKRTYAGWLDAWLKDPKVLRPHTTMPQLFAADDFGTAQRYAVVAYLSSLGGSLNEAKPPTVQPNDLKKSHDLGGKLYLTAGCAACHGEKVGTSTPKKRDDEDETEPLKPEDSLYGLGTAAGPQGVYTLGAVGSKTRSELLAKYLQDPLASNPHGRMPNMLLTPPEALDLARHLCKEVDPKIGVDMPAEPKLDFDPATLVDPDTFKGVVKLQGAAKWRAVGKWLVTSKGCVNCHTIAPGGTALPERPAYKLANVRRLSPGGCVAEKPEPGHKGHADYGLTADERSALVVFLKDGLDGPGSPSPVHAARTALKRFNCLNCHSRDGEGGIDAALAAKMKLNEKAENADDVQPPRLGGVGHKLRSSWAAEVILKAGRARPWMTLRMPQYGPANVGHVPAALPKLEGAVADDAVKEPKFTEEKLSVGRALAGKNGFGCIACHDMSGLAGGGTRGPDLATTNRRVRHEWFARWMHQPQRMAPGTKMPQVFLDGRSLLTTFYGGDADQQLDALWAYFSLGPGLPLPAGMEPPKGMILAAKERPELLRTFLPEGAGTKGVAVGYPGGLNVAFDTQTARLAYAWGGNFLDATPVWNNRGGGKAVLLGAKFYAAPPVNPWALTDSREPPDFARRALDPAYGFVLPEGSTYRGPMAVRFGGYSLDPAGAPTFRYAVAAEGGKGELNVRETPTPVTITVANGLSRKFTLGVPAGKTAWLLAGLGTRSPRIVASDGGELKPQDEYPAAGTRAVVAQDGDRVLVLSPAGLPEGSVWRVAKQSTGAFALLLRLPEGAADAQREFGLTAWALPKDDPELVKGLK